VIANAAGHRPRITSLFHIPDEEVSQEPFGNLVVNYKIEDLSKLTLAEVAKIERHAVKQALHLGLINGDTEPFELEA
jgi:hypothetical protein